MRYQKVSPDMLQCDSRFSKSQIKVRTWAFGVFDKGICLSPFAQHPNVEDERTFATIGLRRIRSSGLAFLDVAELLQLVGWEPWCERPGL